MNITHYSHYQTAKIISSKITALQLLLSSINDIEFKNSCEYLLKKKLYNLGIINSFKQIKKKISMMSILSRRLINIMLRKKMINTFKKGMILMNNNKVFLNSTVITNPYKFIDAKNEHFIFIS